ncbi:hypothetical protein [Sphingomonas sp. OTU376]|uniref:hypothetical protein n=1 Tax=Sphingomonas sp. OTU376 TaxID=3043863 RepID=UPI00313E7CB4
MSEKRSRTRQRATLRVGYPIDAASRAFADAAVECARHCIIPIISEKSQRPFLVGSAVAIRYRGLPCLATAHHVLEDHASAPLGLFGADGNARAFGGAFRISDTHDLAVTLLPPDMAAALSHIAFLDEAQIGSAADAAGRFYGSVAGYPHTASRRHDKWTIETPMEVVSGSAREEAGGFVSVAFDKKEGAWGQAGHVQARDPFGKSGGAIFAMRLSGRAVVPGQIATLVGIATDWKQREKRIIGAAASVLVALLDTLVAESS